MTSTEPAGLLPIELFILLLAIATGVALVARRTAIPNSVALVVAGLALAVAVPGVDINITPELILAVLLPGLVFEAAYKIDVGELRRSFGMVAVLAVPGVLITAAIVAVLVSSLTGLSLGAAFILGAMLSATDPVAVVALFKRLHAPSRLSTVVESESLLNDGTGVVLFAIALKAVSEPVTLAEGAIAFVVTIVASAVIGAAAGWVAERLMRIADDHLIEVAISVVAAYGTYLVADRLHESGIIATVMVGLVLGNAGGARRLSERTREALDITWEFVAFAADRADVPAGGPRHQPGPALDRVAADRRGLPRDHARAPARRVRADRRCLAGHPRAATAARRLPARHVLGRPARCRGRGARARAAGIAARPRPAHGRRVRGRADHAPRPGHDGRLGRSARRGHRRRRGTHVRTPDAERRGRPVHAALERVAFTAMSEAATSHARGSKPAVSASRGAERNAGGSNSRVLSVRSGLPALQ